MFKIIYNSVVELIPLKIRYQMALVVYIIVALITFPIAMLDIGYQSAKHDFKHDLNNFKNGIY